MNLHSDLVESGSQGASILCRDFVRALLAATVAPKMLRGEEKANAIPPPPAPVPWTLALIPHTYLPKFEVTEDIGAPELRSLTPLQMQTLTRLNDVLAPPKEHIPDAVQAGAPKFLNFLIGSSRDTRKQFYTKGVDWLEFESHEKFSQHFARLNDT